MNDYKSILKENKYGDIELCLTIIEEIINSYHIDKRIDKYKIRKLIKKFIDKTQFKFWRKK